MAHGRIIGITLHRTECSPSDVACAANLPVLPISHETAGVVRYEFRDLLQNPKVAEVSLVEKANLREDVFFHTMV
tara:strand:- start:40 stop:264 length:225 start_codon:yes stop_codon:yes gene_type:complete